MVYGRKHLSPYLAAREMEVYSAALPWFGHQEKKYMALFGAFPYISPYQQKIKGTLKKVHIKSYALTSTISRRNSKDLDLDYVIGLLDALSQDPMKENLMNMDYQISWIGQFNSLINVI